MGYSNASNIQVSGLLGTSLVICGVILEIYAERLKTPDTGSSFAPDQSTSVVGRKTFLGYEYLSWNM